MNTLRSLLAFAVCSLPLFGASSPKPLRILLITGGCCHDYVAQKDLLKKGLEARANIVVEHMHTPDKSTRPPLDCLTNPNYAAGFDRGWPVRENDLDRSFFEIQMMGSKLLAIQAIVRLGACRARFVRLRRVGLGSIRWRIGG